MQYSKLFRKHSKTNANLEAVEFDPIVDDYFALIKKYRELDYDQVIISSKVMIKILKEYFLEKKSTITKIEFLEECDYLVEDIDRIIGQVEENRDCFIVLLEHLFYLVQECSMNLSNIEFSWYEGDELVSVFVQANGIIGISNNSYKDKLIAQIE